MGSSTPSSGKMIPASAWKVVAILSSIATMVMYAETMLVPVIPDLIKDFNIPYSTSSWILTTYLITAAVMTPIAGKLSDIYGKKKILLIIMIFYTVGVSIAGFSTNIDFMLIARGFQGVGLSMFPIAFSIVRAQFPRQKMAIGQGIITSMYGGWCSNRSIDWRNHNSTLQLAFHIFYTNTNCHCTSICNLAFYSCDKEEVEQTRKQQQEQKYTTTRQQKQNQKKKESILNL